MKNQSILSKILLCAIISVGSSNIAFAGDASGKFDGKKLQTATMKSTAKSSVSIFVGDEQWYFSPKNTFNINKVVGNMVSGDFNKDGLTDLVCAYDYGNFNVGLIVFISSGSEFKSALWYSSGEKNMNPDAFAGNIRVGDNNKDGYYDVIIPYTYPDNIRSDLVFYSDGNKFYR